MKVKYNTGLVLPESVRSCSVTRTRQNIVQNLLQPGLPYSRRLSMHTSCVNSITFSNDGQWLASAGDDPYIFLWDFHQDDLAGPSHSFRGPRENIFTLAFSASGQHLYSGDTDCMIYRYDLSRLSSSSTDPTRYSMSFTKHEDNIRAISCHPQLDDVFLSASEDGKVLLHDGRAGNGMTDAQATIQNTSEFTSVQYHPTIPHLFVTGDKTGNAYLRDVRMAFGPLSARSQDGIVQTYVTSLSKPSIDHLCKPEIGSLTFDRTGSKLAITFLGYLPTIYSIADPYPIAVCSGELQPNGCTPPAGERTYSNCCTIKHGSFGGPGLIEDEYYAAGSDDFRGYVWKIPPVIELTEDRRVIAARGWSSFYDFIAFTSTMFGERCVPIELAQPHCQLTGHKSIVNSTLWHPHWPCLVTAGVERHILLHSSTPNTPCGVDIPLTSQEVRSLPGPNAEDRRRMIRALTAGGEEDGYDDDMNTIALFDEILRSEGSMDLFASHRWSPDLEDDLDSMTEA